MPDFSDMEDLPFIKATVLETLRWRPIAVVSTLFAFPHGASHTKYPYSLEALLTLPLRTMFVSLFQRFS